MKITPTQLTLETEMATFGIVLKAQSFFKYQHFRTCLRKTGNAMVTDSQPASSKAMNGLQSITESQQSQNARVIVSEECTNIRWGEQILPELSKKIQFSYESIVIETYLCFQRVRLQKEQN